MVTDMMLKEAAGEAERFLLTALPVGIEPHQFSMRFERKMGRLIRRVKHPIRYKLSRSAVAAILVITLAFASVLAISPDVRAAVMNWIRDKIDSFTHYSYINDDTVTESQPKVYFDYVLTQIPDGYIYVNEIERNEGKTYIYVSDSGGMMQFSYLYGKNNNDLYLNAEQYEYARLSQGKITADIYIALNEGESNGIVWINEGEDVLFHISAFLSKDELVALIENVMPVE